IINTAHAKARQVLSNYREQLDAVANRLIVAESIDGDELAKLVQRPEFIAAPTRLNVPILST
ncbi:MAG TPA: hypothetical protein VF932_02335, partial [Anaerolineae bacterium]